ncbi:uncharacterized protein GBIM_00076 [Gryllus bimaculatus]|nr:uncharacterized protein GBIM_00076 [Gryllus bimaculatus]
MFSNADSSAKHRSLYDILEFSSISLGLPLVVTDIYLSLEYPYLASLTHAVGGFLPILTLNICSNILSFEILELELFGSIVSFGYIGLRNRNLWAVGAAFSYAFSYYGLCGYHRENHEPFLCDLFLVGLSLFNIFACSAHDTFANLYDLIEISSICLGIPLITTDMYVHHHYPPEGAFVHAAFGFLPLVGMFVRSDPNVVGAALNSVLFGCTISMIAMGFVNSNYWAVGGGFWYMLIYDFKPSNRYGYEIASLYNFVEMWSIAIGIPFIASDLYFLLHYSYSLSIFHAFLGFVLVAGIVIGTHYMILSYLSLILIGSLLSVVVVGFLNENYWAMAGALSYSVNLYGIKHHGTIGRVPSVDLYTVGLCFFNYFIYKALTDVSIF